jgi:hypothetical protein
VLSGSAPRLTSKSANWPGPTRVPGWAVQVTVCTASVTLPSSVSTGGFSGTLAVAAVQPGIGVVRTDGIGWSVGRVTCSLTVPAVADSVGTRNAIFA